MKKLVLACAFFLSFVTASFSQDQYVEVVVQDTLLTEPQQWLYNASIQSQYSDISIAMDTMPVTPGKGRSLPKTKHTTTAELIALARKYNGRLPDENNPQNFTVVSRNLYSPDATTFVFTDRNSLTGFTKALTAFKDVEGRLVGTYKDDLQQEAAQLDARLIAMARKRGESLAQLSGKKLGAVIQVSENTEGSTNTFKDFLESMIKYDGSRRAELYNFRPDKIKLEKALRVKFVLL